VTSIAEGALAEERKTTPGFGAVCINDYSRGGTPAPGETGTGYDGPCPPFFDARWHYYRFMVFALDGTSPAATRSARSVGTSSSRQASTKDAVPSGASVQESWGLRCVEGRRPLRAAPHVEKHPVKITSDNFKQGDFIPEALGSR